MFEVIGNILEYIINIKLLDVPNLIIYIGASVTVGYCTSLIVIGFLFLVLKSLTGNSIKNNIETKITHIATIILSSIFYYLAFIK